LPIARLRAGRFVNLFLRVPRSSGDFFERSSSLFFQTTPFALDNSTFQRSWRRSPFWFSCLAPFFFPRCLRLSVDTHVPKVRQRTPKVMLPSCSSFQGFSFPFVFSCPIGPAKCSPVRECAKLTIISPVPIQTTHDFSRPSEPPRVLPVYCRSLFVEVMCFAANCPIANDAEEVHFKDLSLWFYQQPRRMTAGDSVTVPIEGEDSWSADFPVKWTCSNVDGVKIILYGIPPFPFGSAQKLNRCTSDVTSSVPCFFP